MGGMTGFMDDWAGGRADGAKTLALDILPVIHLEMAGDGRPRSLGAGAVGQIWAQSAKGPGEQQQLLL